MMNSKSVSTPFALVLAVAVGAAAPACSRSSTAQPTVTPTGSSQGASADTAPHQEGTAAAAPSGGAAAPSAPIAAGPRSELSGDHYALVAALAPPAAVPGEATLTVEIRATGGYHVNELYPMALDLTATNATTRPQLRRADALTLTQQLGAFRVPVQVTAAGASVSGNLRFAVCSEENCVPQARAFAVNLP